MSFNYQLLRRITQWLKVAPVSFTLKRENRYMSGAISLLGWFVANCTCPDGAHRLTAPGRELNCMEKFSKHSTCLAEMLTCVFNMHRLSLSWLVVSAYLPFWLLLDMWRAASRADGITLQALPCSSCLLQSKYAHLHTRAFGRAPRRTSCR